MGRHGGGSRSGGSSRSSSGGSRGGSGGSGVRTSKTPFTGCYNRSYVNRRGKRINFYTSDKNFGASSGMGAGIIFALIFITFHMLVMVGGFAATTLTFTHKINGDRSRIYIEDKIDILTDQEEKEILMLFHNIYKESGMPVALYTDDFSWDFSYKNIEAYSEDLYYRKGMDEDAMVILFTTETVGDFKDWKYDMYCGDETIKCFSDASFDKLLDTFHKALASKNLKDALEYSWGKVIPDMIGVSIVDKGLVIAIPFMVLLYGMFYVAIFGSVKKNKDAYKYFKEHPEELEMTPMTMYRTCPNCGASNSNQTEKCDFCGSSLLISKGNKLFVD